MGPGNNAVGKIPMLEITCHSRITELTEAVPMQTLREGLHRPATRPARLVVADISQFFVLAIAKARWSGSGSINFLKSGTFAIFRSIFMNSPTFCSAEMSAAVMCMSKVI